VGSTSRYRFGVFEFDAQTPELRKAGRLVRLRPQGLKLLTLLMSRPREVIDREEIARWLWDADVFVDVEQGVNHTIKQVRAALGDDAESPRYVETIPRRGYRFIAPVEVLTEPNDVPVPTRSARTLELGGRTSPVEAAPLRVIGWVQHHRVRTILIACALLGSLGAALLVRTRISAAANRPSIAVMPFKTVGGGEEYLADGLTEALTTELGKIPGLRVIASNTAFTYRDRPTLRAVARELNVGLVVTGSVQRNEDSMSINASVIDTRDGATLWSEHFSGTMTDALAVQHDISGQIALTVSRRMGVAPPTTSAPATRSAQAYQAYLRGLWHLKGRSSSRPNVAARLDMRQAAVQELERAVLLDPAFALARATLASAYTQLHFYNAADRRFDQKAFVEIERALRIDPRLPEAYLARAQLTWTALNGFPHEAAIADLRRAVALNPNLADAHLELEKVYYHIGLTDKALSEGEQVQRLDPYQASSTNRRFRTLIDAGRLEQVRLVMDGNANQGAYARADALIALGRLHDALQHLSSSNAIRRGVADYDIGALALLGVVHARLNQPKNAEHVLAMIIPAAENSTGLSHMHHAQLHIGATLSLLGRKDDAVRWLTKAADEGYPSFPRFSTDPSLMSLKGYPPYEALLRRLRTHWERWKRSL
jgi:TolB-like protein/DNA-binding winged helix-turn-helix (wHTH) protein/tetratricopeptide (TPR) repeat protein